MSGGDLPFQYHPYDKMKVYKQNALVNSMLRKLNFGASFSLTEVPGTDSVDIDIAAGVLTLDNLADVSISLPLSEGQTLVSNGTELVNAFLLLDNLGNVVITSPADGSVLRYHAGSGTWIDEVPASGVTTLDGLTDVVITTPAVAQVLRNNGTNWVNALLALNDLSDVDITSPVTAQVLRHNGTLFVNSLLSSNDLSDFVITSPTAGQIIEHNGTNFVNVTPSAAATREDLCSVLAPCGLDNPGTSYADLAYYHITTGGSNVYTTKAIAPIDFTGKTQYKVDLNLRKPGSTDYDIRIIDDASASNVLHEFLAIAEGSHVTSLTSIPAWGTGVKTLRLQGKTGNSTDDIGIPHCSVYLK